MVKLTTIKEIFQTVVLQKVTYFLSFSACLILGFALYNLYQSGCVADLKAGLGGAHRAVELERFGFLFGVSSLFLASVATFFRIKTDEILLRFMYGASVFAFGFIVFWVVSLKVSSMCTATLY